MAIFRVEQFSVSVGDEVLADLRADPEHAVAGGGRANGWPIATGVIEGACRHLVQDRMGITGARRGLAGAPAILWPRGTGGSGDTGASWHWHVTREHQRNHLSRYQDTLEPAA